MLVKVLDLYTVSVVNFLILVVSKITRSSLTLVLSYLVTLSRELRVCGFGGTQVHEIIQLAECNTEHCRGKGLSTESYRPAKHAYKYASRLVDYMCNYTE